MTEESKKPKKPRKPFDAEDCRQIRELARIQCTLNEIAAVMGCSIDMLKNPKYRYHWQEGRLEGQSSLRRMQWKQAETSASMAIWLGKVCLGQKEPQGSADKLKGTIIEYFEGLREGTKGQTKS